MQLLDQKLSRARNGGAILFCGAGFSADCLNFDDTETVGVTVHLLEILNEALKLAGKQHGYRDIKNAAKRAKMELGSHKLMNLLKDRFSLSKVSASITDIAAYPWDAVYTTNYDNAVELALQAQGKKYQPINNTADPDLNEPNSGTPVIHLHGRAIDWTDHNFDKSCILDTDSYHQLDHIAPWLRRLRYDFDRAEVVVFIGFSAADFHLGDVFFNSTGLKNKAFFINRPTSSPNIDEQAVQEDFGNPLYIGREDLANIASRALRTEQPHEPRLASFSRFHAVKSSASVPPVKDVEDLLFWGTIVEEHVKRDLDIGKSDYHVLGTEIEDLTQLMSSPGAVHLVNGDICNGKSLLALQVMMKVSSSRPVFSMRHAYDDIVSEVSGILTTYPNSIFVVENCFSLNIDRLIAIARLISASEGGLLLKSRTIAADAEGGKLKRLTDVPNFSRRSLGKLSSQQADDLIALIDQIAGWRDFPAMSAVERRRFVEKDCNSVLPSVLLRVVQSEYVRKKYKEEYNKLSFLSDTDRKMVVSCLIISSIGFETPASFISEIFSRDISRVASSFSEQTGALKLIQVHAGVVHTIPSIGARTILNSVIPPRDVVEATIGILESLSEVRSKSDFERHIFTQLMRYSILAASIEDAEEINRFFDHISKINFYREMPLFWLQWHMAMSAQEDWPKADHYLGMGEKAADIIDRKSPNHPYNRKQLQDRRAKFLAARAVSEKRVSAPLFRDLKEALDIVGRLLKETDLTYHPFQTLADIARAIRVQGSMLMEVQLPLITALAENVSRLAASKINFVPEGYQRAKANENYVAAEISLKARTVS